MGIESVLCPLCVVAPIREIQASRPYGLWECSGCGLMFSSPRPDGATHRAFHDEKYFRGYYGQGIDEFHARKGELYARIHAFNETRLAILRRHKMQGQILDVGVGQGLFLDVARAAGYEPSGCDVSTYIAGFHRSRGIDVRPGTVEETFVQPGTFDAITLWQTLEHTLNPVQTLMHVRSLLRPDGVAIVSVPNMDGLVAQVKLWIGKPFLGEGSTELHFFHFRPCALDLLLRATGFEIVDRDAEPSQDRRRLIGGLERFGDLLRARFGWEVAGSVTRVVRPARG